MEAILENAIHIPKSGENLISVKELSNKGLKVMFNKSEAKILKEETEVARWSIYPPWRKK